MRHSAGAAGTVVCNLAALEAGEVIPVGFTGDDGEGYELRQDLARLGCPLDHLYLEHSPSHPHLSEAAGYYRSQPCRGTSSL